MNYPLCQISRLHDAITAGDEVTAAGAAILLARAFADDDLPPPTAPALPAPAPALRIGGRA